MFRTRTVIWWWLCFVSCALAPYIHAPIRMRHIYCATSIFHSNETFSSEDKFCDDFLSKTKGTAVMISAILGPVRPPVQLVRRPLAATTRHLDAQTLTCPIF